MLNTHYFDYTLATWGNLSTLSPNYIHSNNPLFKFNLIKKVRLAELKNLNIVFTTIHNSKKLGFFCTNSFILILFLFLIRNTHTQKYTFHCGSYLISLWEKSFPIWKANYLDNKFHDHFNVVLISSNCLSWQIWGLKK